MGIWADDPFNLLIQLLAIPSGVTLLMMEKVEKVELGS